MSRLEQKHEYDGLRLVVRIVYERVKVKNLLSGSPPPAIKVRE